MPETLVIIPPGPVINYKKLYRQSANILRFGMFMVKKADIM